MIMGFTLSNINKLHPVNASTNSRSYFKYEASDGGYFGFYTLPQTNNLSRSIINLPDDRVNDKVYNGVVKLITEFRFFRYTINFQRLTVRLTSRIVLFAF